MQRCGFCSLLSGLLRRAMCVGSRRGSGDSYRREDPKLDRSPSEIMESDSSQNKAVEILFDFTQHGDTMDSDESLLKYLEIDPNKILNSRKFLTMHRRRKKRLTTRSLTRDVSLLDDVFHGQAKLIVNQSAMWNFNAFILENVSGGRSLPVLMVHLFQVYDLFDYFHLDVASAWKLFSLIEEGYHSTNPYHNSIHATDVTQAMHCFLQEHKIFKYLKPLEILSSLIGASAHDVDHPGVNQPFLVATSNHLASLYQNSSVLENHHWRSAVGCLVESGIAKQLEHVWDDLQEQISSLILATDITRHQEFLGKFKNYIDGPHLDFNKAEDRSFILQICLKCADISNPCRPWDVSSKWSLKVCEEFFRQGDYERKLNLPITSLCDRHTNSIPKIQTGFFKFVVTPLISEWDRFMNSDLSKFMMKNLKSNEIKWDSMLGQEMGEETRTEFSDTENIEDYDEDVCAIDELTSSAEKLLPYQDKTANESKELVGSSKRRFSVPASVMSTAISLSRRDSLPVQERKILRKALTVAEQGSFSELDLYQSVLSLGLKEESSNVDCTDNAENLLPDVTIANITSSLEANRLNHVLYGCGSKRGLFRQQTFPPVMPYTRARYLSAAGEMPSCIESLMENSISESSSCSQLDRAEILKEKIDSLILPEEVCGNICSEVGNSEERLLSIETSAEDNNTHSILQDADNKGPASGNIEDDKCSYKGVKKKPSFGGNYILEMENNPILDKRQDNTRRRGSAPVDVRSECRRFNLMPTNHSGFSGTRAKILIRRSSGGAELVKEIGLLSIDNPSDNIWCHWLKQANYELHENTYVNPKRRGSLPVEVLAMTGNICH